MQAKKARQQMEINKCKPVFLGLGLELGLGLGLGLGLNKLQIGLEYKRQKVSFL